MKNDDIFNGRIRINLKTGSVEHAFLKNLNSPKLRSKFIQFSINYAIANNLNFIDESPINGNSKRTTIEESANANSILLDAQLKSSKVIDQAKSKSKEVIKGKGLEIVKDRQELDDKASLEIEDFDF